MPAFELPPRLPLDAQRGQTFSKLVELMQRLLAPDGCPWDREQTPESLRRYVLEEACEVIDAIDSGSPAELSEELGDLALQIVFLAEIGRQRGLFGPDDALYAICEKLVRRHPHVFGDGAAEDSNEVVRNWEAIKAQEKPRKLLDGIPASLPALMRAQKLSARAAQVGFDWPDARGSREKIAEETLELEEAVRAGDQDRIEAELGDLLFAWVNWARHQGIEPERALQRANDKFSRRFRHVESQVEARFGGWPQSGDGKPTRGLALEQLDAFWDEAKARE